MTQLEELVRELERRGKAGALRELAASDGARRPAQRLDAGAVEEAARRGDAAALAELLRGVLGTAEGKRLAQEIGERMK